MHRCAEFVNPLFVLSHFFVVEKPARSGCLAEEELSDVARCGPMSNREP